MKLTVKVLCASKRKSAFHWDYGQLSPDPWETLPDRCPQGKGQGDRPGDEYYRLRRVCREIEPGVEGLIRHFRNDVEPADEASEQGGPRRRSGGSCRARSKTAGTKRLLGDQTTGSCDLWTTVAERYSIGSVVEGRASVSWRTPARSRKSKKGRGRLGARFGFVVDQINVKASLGSVEKAGQVDARAAIFTGSTLPTGDCRWRETASARTRGEAFSGRRKRATWSAGAFNVHRSVRRVRGACARSRSVVPPVGNSADA